MIKFWPESHFSKHFTKVLGLWDYLHQDELAVV